MKFFYGVNTLTGPFMAKPPCLKLRNRRYGHAERSACDEIYTKVENRSWDPPHQDLQLNLALGNKSYCQF